MQSLELSPLVEQAEKDGEGPWRRTQSRTSPHGEDQGSSPSQDLGRSHFIRLTTPLIIMK